MVCQRNTIKETLLSTAYFLKVQTRVIQESDQEKISDDGKSDEGNCFDMFEYE